MLNIRDHLTSLGNAKVKLNELYDRVLDNLENATLGIKALLLDAQYIKVYAKGNYDLEIIGVIPLELALPATARTWGCLSSHAYSFVVPFGLSIRTR